MRRLLGVALVASALAVSVPRAAAAASTYAPPVDGPIVDHFRPPPTPYGPGNRGVDFATEPGEPVAAAADGQVVFAGAVGGSLHVVVLHADGLRTSYSFLASVAVHRGDHVAQGDVVGHAGGPLHFGVRAGDVYLDPEPLLDGRAPDVHLVPIEDRAPGSVASEVRGLLGGIGRRVLHAGATGAGWVGDGAAMVATGAWEVVATSAEQVAALAEATQYYLGLPAREWAKRARAGLFEASQRRCTPARVPPPTADRSGRIAVLVGGLGSTSDHASIREVDTHALGYADDHVAVFSYAGGQTPGDRHVAGVEVNRYTAEVADGDLRDAARRFRALLVDIRLAHPGMAVDVVAHSQGGVVVRAALGGPGDATDPRLPPVEHLITLGSPHHGADLATANQAIGLSPAGNGAQVVLDQLGVDATSDAVAQLSERSGFVADLQDRPLPPGARVTSIAAAGDVVVPALQSALAGATNVVVPLRGLGAHADLPGSPAAARELALALGDQGPTCRDPSADLRLAWGIGLGEDVAGGALGAAGAAVSVLAAAG